MSDRFLAPDQALGQVEAGIYIPLGDINDNVDGA